MNSIKLAGTVETVPHFSHESHGKRFFGCTVSSKRLSGTKDFLECIIPEPFEKKFIFGSKIKIYGEIRSRNTFEDNKRHCFIYVFVQDVIDYMGVDENAVNMSGRICKEPRVRVTPKGRDVADVLIACERLAALRCDFIPCITWGRNALKSGYGRVNDEVYVTGRFQSRTYLKELDTGVGIEKVAYEVSIRDFLFDTEVEGKYGI